MEVWMKSARESRAEALSSGRHGGRCRHGRWRFGHLYCRPNSRICMQEGLPTFSCPAHIKKAGENAPALGSLPNGKPITLYHVLYENPRELEAFSDVSGISSLSGSKLMPGDFKPLTCINGLEAIYLATSGQPLRLCTP